MGQYLEDLLDGTCCQICGEYLGGSPGFARTCNGCVGAKDWKEEREAPATDKAHPMIQEVILEDGEVRDARTLEKLGHYFEEAVTLYWLPLNA